MEQKLEDVEEELRVATEARNAEVFGSDEYKLRNEEVISLRSSVDALRNQIAAEKQAGKVPPNLHQSPAMFSLTFCLCLLCVYMCVRVLFVLLFWRRRQ